jgi:hypothetical protein
MEEEMLLQAELELALLPLKPTDVMPLGLLYCRGVQ